jgi:DNA-binding Lrp family transcriptional regulator
VRVAVADTEDYERIHKTQLSRLPHVARIKTSFALRTICNKTTFEF